MHTVTRNISLRTHYLPAAALALSILSPTQLQAAETAGGGDFLSADQKGSSSADKLFQNGAASEQTDGWSGKASAGIVNSTGNADNRSMTLGLEAKYAKQRWLHTLASNIYFAENSGTKTAERYGVSHKLDYKLNDKSYAFNFLSYDSDKFANIDSRLADVVGYGRNLLSGEKHKLDAELGVGARQTKFSNGDPDSKETVGHLGLHYTGKLTDTTTLSEDLLVQSGSDNTYTQSVTALSVAMTEKLSLSLNYTVNNNSKVPAGVEKTDTVTSVNLVAGF